MKKQELLGILEGRANFYHTVGLCKLSLEKDIGLYSSVISQNLRRRHKQANHYLSLFNPDIPMQTIIKQLKNEKS